jgi:hypothetical protein
MKEKDLDDKKTIAVLFALIKRGVLSREEEEAVRSAIGILSWTSLAESRLKSIKAKREKEGK